MTSASQARRSIAPTDIPKSQQANEALGQSAAIVRALLSTMPDMVFRIDGAGTYLGFIPSPELQPLVPASEFLGRKIHEVMPAEVAERSMNTIKRVLQTGRTKSFEYQLVVDGEVHIYEARFVASGKNDVLAIVRDISERRQAEASAETDRRRLETLVDTCPVGVFVTDAGGQVMLINKEAQRILGFSHQSDYELGRYEQAAVYRRPDGRPYELEDLPLERALYRGETVRAEEILFDFPDGHAVSTLVDAAPAYSADGKIDGAIAIIQDMTPLGEVEGLCNDFLGMVSHELRTPLTAIKGAAETALRSPMPIDASETRELLRIVDEQADRLWELLDSLLDMSHIEAGTFSVSPEPSDLQGLLEEALTSFVSGGGSQEVHLDLPADLPAVKADRPKVIQVLTNLLSNAAKFSPEVAVITVAAEHEGGHVTVRVQDQGRGIAREQLAHLFQKFSQVHEDCSGTFCGSGLGLAISSGIVKAHGGRIWAESVGEGQGSTFSFTLPLAPAATDHEGAVDAISDGERKRVFVVDADRQVVRYLRRALADAGHDLIEPSSWVDIAAQVEGEEPDLILLDLLVPGTDGFEILKRIRRFSDVPVIILTAKDDSESVVRALRLGADDYVSKPFSPSEVLARIDAILRRRDGRPTQRAPFSLGGLRIDFAERQVTVDGKPVSLTKTEYKLLSELAANAGQVLTHDQILDRVWGEHFVGGADLVRAFIRSVRRKLGDDARQPRYLLTERGVGYRMAKPA